MKKKSFFSLLVILVAVVMLGSFALAGSVDLQGNALMIIADVEDRMISGVKESLKPDVFLPGR